MPANECDGDRFMNTDDVLDAEENMSAGASRRAFEPQASLHGRLLNVSRMATIGEMAAGVAHELNQPLTAIATYAQACERLLTRPLTDPSDLAEAFARSRRRPSAPPTSSGGCVQWHAAIRARTRRPASMRW